MSPPSSNWLIYVTEQPNKNSEMYVQLKRSQFTLCIESSKYVTHAIIEQKK